MMLYFSPQLKSFVQELEIEIQRVLSRSEIDIGPWNVAVDCMRQLVSSGGKRIRPQLMAMSYLAAGGKNLHRGLVRFATGIELIHNCMLIHDDVMDQSAVRRGGPALHHALLDRHLIRNPRLAEGVAIVQGDALASFATREMVCEELDIGLARRAADAIYDAMRDAAAGQVLDLTYSDCNIDEVDADAITEVYRLKTAGFTFSGPLQSGAILADKAPEIEQGLRLCGCDLGVAFQIRDDIIGLLGDRAKTGKQPEDDIREGKKSLLLRALWDRASSWERNFLVALVGRRQPSPQELEQVRTMIRESGALANTEEKIDELTSSALRRLSELPLVEQWRELLKDLTKLLARREA